MSDKKLFYSLEEIADLLGVHYQLIYRLVRNGELPAVRLGRVYRVSQSDLDGYLEANRTQKGLIGGVCSSCGKTYESSLSLQDGCEECGAAICKDCWTRKGVRVCREHGADSK